MPKKYPLEVHDCVVRMALDRLGEYPSIWASAEAMAANMENRNLKEAISILRAASIFFARELDPRVQ